MLRLLGRLLGRHPRRRFERHASATVIVGLLPYSMVAPRLKPQRRRPAEPFYRRRVGRS